MSPGDDHEKIAEKRIAGKFDPLTILLTQVLILLPKSHHCPHHCYGNTSPSHAYERFSNKIGRITWMKRVIGKESSKKVTTALKGSHVVANRSTNRALTSLTLEIERDPVQSGRYGRSRRNMAKSNL